MAHLLGDVHPSVETPWPSSHALELVRTRLTAIITHLGQRRNELDDAVQEAMLESLRGQVDVLEEQMNAREQDEGYSTNNPVSPATPPTGEEAVSPAFQQSDSGDESVLTPADESGHENEWVVNKAKGAVRENETMIDQAEESVRAIDEVRGHINQTEERLKSQITSHTVVSQELEASKMEVLELTDKIRVEVARQADWKRAWEAESKQKCDEAKQKEALSCQLQRASQENGRLEAKLADTQHSREETEKLLAAQKRENESLAQKLERANQARGQLETELSKTKRSKQAAEASLAAERRATDELRKDRKEMEALLKNKATKLSMHEKIAAGFSARLAALQATTSDLEKTSGDLRLLVGANITARRVLLTHDVEPKMRASLQGLAEHLSVTDLKREKLDMIMTPAQGVHLLKSMESSGSSFQGGLKTDVCTVCKMLRFRSPSSSTSGLWARISEFPQLPTHLSEGVDKICLYCCHRSTLRDIEAFAWDKSSKPLLKNVTQDSDLSLILRAIGDGNIDQNLTR
ncbi:hypothetical protein ACJ41O_012326 [Fusarium nematophilum]